MIRRLILPDTAPGVTDNDFQVPFISDVDGYMLLSVSGFLVCDGTASTRRMMLRVLDRNGTFVMPHVRMLNTAPANAVFHFQFRAGGVGAYGIDNFFAVAGYGGMMVGPDDVIGIIIDGGTAGDRLTNLSMVLDDVFPIV